MANDPAMPTLHEVRLSRQDLEMIEEALQFLLISSDREDHVFAPIWGTLDKIEKALGRPKPGIWAA